MPNRLAHESSPYLLQHQNNPVDWYPWGEEALARAKREEKPIFLSIGYSACHWCHVMEHESFEDEKIAGYLNANFVPIKVDREERPDLDQIYMNAVQLLTGHGGWPMSVFLTPDLQPFYGGTYWPPHAGRGMAGFDQVLVSVMEAWKNRRDEVDRGAANLTEQIQAMASTSSDARAADAQLTEDILRNAGRQLSRSFDSTYGGFGQAPKFPHPMDLQVLLRLWQRTEQPQYLDMVRTTLDRMAAGGIYDHLGGGFARYSVDARWLVPHFEKMLYDNALLAGTYLDAYLALSSPGATDSASADRNEALAEPVAPDYGCVVRETLDYTLRDMTDPAGGFYSTEDADTEGEEGKYYTWSPQEIRDVLGDEAGATFCRVYDVSDEGNFEGKNILNLPKTIPQCAKLLNREEGKLEADLAASRAKLLTAREQRVRPGRDDKVIVAWNGLMIDTMARAGAALGEPRYIEAAQKAADFILGQMRDKRGRLYHTWRHGKPKLSAYLDDYASFANALVSVYEASFVERYIDAAAELCDTLLSKFADAAGNGFFYTADDHEQLIARNKEFTDSSTPSGNALAATALLRLGKLTGRSQYLDAAYATIATAVPLMERAPLATGQLLLAFDLQLGPTPELVLLAGDARDGQAALAQIQKHFMPRKVLAARTLDATVDRSPLLEPLLAGKTPVNGHATLYVCENHACQAPLLGVQAITEYVASVAKESL
ncbi:MAG: thioredoxin domain-containing protein [Pirellulales bacterium]